MASRTKPPRTAPLPKKEAGEAAEVAVSTALVRARTFLEQYRRWLIAAAAGVVVIVLAVLGFFYWQHAQAQQANELLAQILPLYEQGRFEEALAGTDELVGLQQIAADYARTPAGRLAAFYAGHAFFMLERFDEADRYFERYRSDPLLEASALSGRAGIAEERGDHRRAAELYRQAADRHPTAAAAPENLLNAARNYEAIGDFEAARRAYQRIEEAFPESPLAAEVPIYLARLEVLAQPR